MNLIAIDANLLTLLLVGLTDRTLIGKHKRTNTFEAIDFDKLSELLGNYQAIIISPNVATETSNLIAQIGEPACSAIRTTMAAVLQEDRFGFKEIYHSTIAILDHPLFLRLGLTDCSLLHAIGTNIPLLTTDLSLYLEAQKQNHQAINFTHIRQSWLLG